jgi:hypothetical protein
MLKQQSKPISPEADLTQLPLERTVRLRVIPQLLQLHGGRG